MESHSSSSSLSSSFYLYQNPEGTTSHGTQPVPAKPWKKAVAPLPPTLPRVYKVDPINFRDVVQKLTAAPEFQDRRLHAMPAPRPSLSNPPSRSAFSGEGSVSYNGYPGAEFSERY